MQRELRRSMNSLRVTGLGTIALSVWSVIKTVLFIELEAEAFETAFRRIMGDMYERSAALGTLFFILTADLLFRVFVGLRARREGLGKKCGSFYLLIDLFFIFVAAFDIYQAFLPDYVSFSGEGILITVIFELTALYTAASLLCSSIKVKVLENRLKEGV